MKPDPAAEAPSSDQCELLPPDIDSECPAEFLESSGDPSERFRQLDAHVNAVAVAKSQYELRRVFAGIALEIISTKKLYAPFPSFEAYLASRPLPNVSVVGKWRRAGSEWLLLRKEKLKAPHQVSQLLHIRSLPSLESKRAALNAGEAISIARSQKKRAARKKVTGHASAPSNEPTHSSVPSTAPVVSAGSGSACADETATYYRLKALVQTALDSHAPAARMRIAEQLIADLLAAKQGIANVTQLSGASSIAEEHGVLGVNSASNAPMARLIDEIIDRLQLAPLIHRERRTTMNGKPVRDVAAQTVVNFESGFAQKLLCTGPIANLGDGCGFNCAFCYYLASLPAIQARKKQEGAGPKIMTPGQAVLRRKDAIRVAIANLHDSRGNLRAETQRHHVLFSSTSVDPAANMELARETAALCRVLLDLTVWEIRLLSKSSLLPKIHELIPEQHRHRMIYGVSTGTLDDKLAGSFEQGTALVSKRGASIRHLQDLGARTFGMICPSLPVDDADAFSKEMCAFLRVDRMEEVWAEVLNVRGASMEQTCAALDAGGFKTESAALGRVSKGDEAWETYSKETFLAHTRHVPKGKLRFLQYVGSEAVAPWWREQRANGAVLLGKYA